MIEFLICFLVVIAVFYLIYLKIKYKVKSTLSKYFNTTSLKEAINQSEIMALETPKSLFGMESVYIPLLKQDFPELNINELKRIAEEYIIESKNKEETKPQDNVSSKVIESISEQKNYMNENDINIENIKIHKTIVNKYEKASDIATIYFQTALEYTERKGTNKIKKQDRIKTEFIYIIDEKTAKSRNKKAVGLNCPNCGAVVKNIGEKYCEYCGSGIIDIVKKSWILNDITQL